MAKKKRTSSAPWKIYSIFAIICAIAAYIAFNVFTEYVSNSDSRKSQATKSNSDGIPKYEEYIEMAKSRHWHPVDPMDKLKTTCRKYSQAFHAADSRKTNEIIQMLQGEAEFLLSVFKNSPHRFIDLTEVFFEALEGIHRSLFHVQKQILQTQSKRVVTRAEAEHYSKSFIYNLLTALLRSTIQSGDGATTLETGASPQYPHLTLDLNRPLGRDGSGSLATAVGLRLFRLYAPLVSAGADMTGAVEQAIINNDAFSLSLLLNISVSTGIVKTASASVLDLACSQGSISILEILQRHTEILSSHGVDVRMQVNVLAECIGMRKGSGVGVEAEVLPLLAPEWDKDGKGFMDFGLLSPEERKLSEHTSGNEINEVSSSWEGLTNKCGIDVIANAADISPAEFVEKYVKRRRPVVLRGLIDPDIQNVVWSYEALLEYGGDVVVTPQSIPYGNQMGASQKSQPVDLKSYMVQMREFSHQLKKWISRYFTTDNAGGVSLDRHGALSYQDATGKWVVLNISAPLYVFDNEIISSAPPTEEVMTNPFQNNMKSILNDEKSSAKFKESKKLGDLIRATHKSIQRSSSMKSQTSITRQFYMGPSLSGAPFHSHSHAFNALMHGRKLWLLLSPGHDLYSNIPPIQWSQSVAKVVSEDERISLYPYFESPSADGSQDFSSTNYDPCYLEQRAGEVLFVPSMWTHQILNLAESVGFATEVHY